VVTGNLPGVSYDDQLKNSESVTGGWNKVEGRYFSYFIFALLFRFIYHGFDFPAYIPPLNVSTA